ncbi:MAG: cyclophilin-like fold protein [Succiniclasticum sp.]|jgi:hypothetical protein
MKRYKKWFVFLTAMILAFSLSACSGNAQNGKSNTAPTSRIQESAPANPSSQKKGEETMIKMTVNGTTLTAALVDNSSTKALKELLANGPITVKMHDYGNMEKVGSLGRSLPTNDEQITTEAGDLILYQGNQLVIYYAPNTWDFTRLGKIKGVTASELRKILGSGNVTVTLTAAK